MPDGAPDTQSESQSAALKRHDAQPLSAHPPSDSPAEATTTEPHNAGLYDGFEAYRTPDDADYNAVLTQGTIVLDTNVLLDLYRHNRRACDDLLSVLDLIKERLWIPRQVLQEFWSLREDVIRDNRGTVRITQTLQSQRGTAVKELHSWAKVAALSKEFPAELVKSISDTFEAVIDRITQHANPDADKYLRNTSSDPILLRLEVILEGNVGAPFSEKEYAAAVEEAKRRGREKRPPGFRDVGPDGSGPPGDCILWLQTIKQAQLRREDILFVTGDEKDDWWRQEGKDKELRGPRPELAVELKRAAGVRLFMLRPDELLSCASQVLNVDVPEETVEEVKRVSSQAFVSSGTTDDDARTLRTQLADVLERLAFSRQAVADDHPGNLRYVRSAEALRGLASYIRERADDDPRLLRINSTIGGDASLIGTGKNWHLAFDRYGSDWELDTSDGLDMLLDAIEADHPKND